MAIINEEAAARLKELFASSPAWKDLADSQFVEHLIIFFGLTVEDALFRVERARQESFVATALNRSSITAFVEDRDYLPRKAQPATGTVTITNPGLNPVTLLKGRELLSETQRTYTLQATVIIPAGGSIQAPVSQVKKQTVKHIVAASQAFYEIILDRSITSQINAIEVLVDEDGRGDVAWGYHRLLQNSYATTKAWDEFYKFTDQIGIRFGNGTFGYIPPVGSRVTINLDLTDGATILMPKQQLYPVKEVLDSAGNTATITIAASSIITNGEDAEGTEEIRRNLHYWPVYNERLIWDNDYTYFIRRRFPEVVFVKAWGEEEAEKMYGFSYDHVNKIYISAYANRSGVKENVMSALAGVPMMNRRFVWVEPVHVTFSLAITGKVLSDRSLDEVKSDIKDVLAKYYGKDSLLRRDKNLISEIYEAIQSTGHFGSDSGAYFEAVASGQVAPDIIFRMPSIDLDVCTFNLSYKL